jgi:Kef-type K+ transport system membrane component KefB
MPRKVHPTIAIVTQPQAYMISHITGGYTFLLAFIYVLLMVFLVRPIVHLIYRRVQRRKDAADSTIFSSMLFLMVLVSAFTSEVIGMPLLLSWLSQARMLMTARQVSTHSLAASLLV